MRVVSLIGSHRLPGSIVGLAPSVTKAGLIWSHMGIERVLPVGFCPWRPLTIVNLDGILLGLMAKSIIRTSKAISVSQTLSWPKSEWK